MSGEHGDGLARSVWNRKLFGPEVYAALRGGQARVRPRQPDQSRQGRRRPDPGANLRIGPEYRPIEPDATLLDFSGQGGFARAVEMCSGVGACRKTGTGTMCPSYMVTRDEDAHHPRPGQRLAAGHDRAPARRRRLANETLYEALDLCLQCKACKTECPSKVDMAKLKAEFLLSILPGPPRPLGSNC